LGNLKFEKAHGEHLTQGTFLPETNPGSKDGTKNSETRYGGRAPSGDGMKKVSWPWQAEGVGLAIIIFHIARLLLERKSIMYARPKSALQHRARLMATGGGRERAAGAKRGTGLFRIEHEGYGSW
jgi:hypothetical protein